MDRKWQAKWITSADFLPLRPIDPTRGERAEHTAADAEGYTLQINRHQIFRKVFTMPARFGRVQAAVTADDFYRLYINGSLVGLGPAPGYLFHYNYNVIDITRYLHPGENLIAAEVTYEGYRNRVVGSADLRMGFLCEIYDAKNIYAATDGSWLTARLNCWHAVGFAGYETQMLDHLEAARYDSRWKSDRDYAKDLVPASVNIHDDHVLYRQITPTVDFYLLKAERQYFAPDGALILDFGREITASLAIHIRGMAGSCLRIRYSEELQEDGSLRYPMRCIKNEYEDRIYFSGGEDVFEPMSYKAFRYVELQMDPRSEVSARRELEAAAASVLAVVRHYPMPEEACRFRADDARLSKIFEFCKNGVRCGTQEGYLDCPSREKGQYLGDAVITSHAQYLLTGDSRQFRKCIMDFAYSSAICPGMLGVAPGAYVQHIADYVLLYPYMVENFIRLTGERDILGEVLPVISDMLAWFGGHMREDGLLHNVSRKWNLVDWPDGDRDGYDFPLEQPTPPGCHNVINALWYGALSIFERLRGLCPKYAYLTAPIESEKVAKSFRAAFGGGEGGLFRDTEASRHTAWHSNIYPLFFGMANLEERRAILDMIRRRGLSGSVFNAYFVLLSLCRAGEADLAFDMIRRDGERSWARMLADGATACFEAWGKDAKWNTSLCHPWSSTPVIILAEYAAGIRFVDPAAGVYAVRPRLPAGVSGMHFTVKLGGGRITVDAERGKPPRVRLSGGLRLE